VLVLDLRRNPGGTELLGQELAGMLLPPGTTYFRLQSRDERGAWGMAYPHPVRSDPTAPPFDGPLLCLIDEWTFSVADNLAACLADTHPDVTFVGRPTGGGTGAPQPFELPASGATVALCTMRVYSPSRGLIEGRGTRPDVVVRLTREDLLTGRDADLEAALGLARRRLAIR
jgi:C-terminal processing protease CtpA/Prc